MGFALKQSSRSGKGDRERLISHTLVSVESRCWLYRGLLVSFVLEILHNNFFKYKQRLNVQLATITAGLFNLLTLPSLILSTKFFSKRA